MGIKEIERLITKGIKFEKRYQFDRALYFYNEILKIIKRFKPKNKEQELLKYNILAIAMLRKGAVFNFKCYRKRARKIILKALQYARKSKDEIMIARCILGLGVLETYNYNYDKAEKLLRKALKMFEKGRSYNYKQGICWSLLNLGNMKL